VQELLYVTCIKGSSVFSNHFVLAALDMAGSIQSAGQAVGDVNDVLPAHVFPFFVGI